MSPSSAYFSNAPSSHPSSSPHRGHVFLLLGSGPGIGLALAKAFATSPSSFSSSSFSTSKDHHQPGQNEKDSFKHIVLLARSPSHLAREKAAVLAAAGEAGRAEGEVYVHTFAVDICDAEALRAVLRQVQELGELACVWHNAARVRFSEVLTAEAKEVEEDWKTNALSLYTIAQQCIPLLLKSTHPNPSFLATSSHLPETPMPILLSLSMAKAAQQNLVTCLHEAFGEKIHFGVIKVCGVVSEEAQTLSPGNIAREAVKFWQGGRAAGLSVVLK